jgi:hypothetical protein
MSAEPTATAAEPTETKEKKPSRLKKIQSIAFTGAVYTVPAVMVGGSMFYGWKLNSMALETAKLQLETAALNAAQAAS